MREDFSVWERARWTRRIRPRRNGRAFSLAGFTAKAIVRNLDGTVAADNLTATVSRGEIALSLPTTHTLTAGEYDYEIDVESADARHTVRHGRLTVRPALFAKRSR